MIVKTLLAICLMLMNHSLKSMKCNAVYVSTKSSSKCINGMLDLQMNEYFKNEPKCIFPPGVYHIKSPQMLYNVDNVELIGSGDLIMHTIAEKINDYGLGSYGLDGNITYFESSTQIICDHSQSGFIFVNVSNLIIANLTILNCGLFTSITSVNASIHMVNISNLLMDGVSIQNSTGYGLWGVNILGQSKLIRSSFVGNNQFVKGLLHKSAVSGFPWSDGEIDQSTTAVYENDGSLDCNLFAGGNVVLNYNELSHSMPNTKYELLILSCLFSLAVDLSYVSQSKTTLFCNDTIGTGLSIIMNQNGSYYLKVEISNTTLYRNQANFGANLLLDFDPNSNSIALKHVSSMYGIGFHGGLCTISKQHLTIPQPRMYLYDLTITESTFKFNFSPDSSIPQVYISSSLPRSLHVYVTKSSFQQSAVCLSVIKAYIHVLFDTCSFELSDVLILADSGHRSEVGFSNCNFRYSSLTNSQATDDTLQIQYNYCTLEHSGITVLSSNIAINCCTFIYSRLHAIDSSVSLNGTVQFAHNSYNHNGGAISLYSSNTTLTIFSNITFINNTAVNGGAIYMDESSFIIFPSAYFQVKFINNTAKLAGGAIYAKTLSSFYTSHSTSKCFFHILISNDFSQRVYLYFDGNSAGEAGSVLFGGSIENCPPWPFDHFWIGPQSKSSSVISSEPMYICACINGTECDASRSINFTQGRNIVYMIRENPAPKCQLSSVINTTLYPGQKLKVSFITYGQAYGSAPAIVFVYSNNSEIEFISTIRSYSTCKMYQIKLDLKNGTQCLTTQHAFDNGKSNINNICISLTVLPCPTGFDLDNTNELCVCTSLLQKYKLNCNIENGTVQTIGNKWIGVTANNDLGLLDQCPLDYCKSTGIINVSNLDSQCAFSRQGVLCGQCQDGLSMTFGTSQCKKCSNYYLLLIIPFALMGVALVGLLFLLNLTVATGSLNGLIFYANIIKINDKIFSPTNYAANNYFKIFYMFIAWLNLDLGIETCFYNGMDSYAKTWLQFAFPIYIYVLVYIIILAGRYSTTVSKLCRFNGVSVLATLIQLSYSKVLCTIITIFSSASIDAEHTVIPPVWLYDGNIEFLSSKHIPLFIFGLLITSLLIIPYSISLLFIPCLQSKSHWKFLKWVNMLKPFLDCHAAPYKDHFRFWAGVLLVVRFLLYLVFALAYSVSIRLLGIVIFVCLYSLLLSWLSLYRKWYHTILELFFNLNLAALSIAHLFEPSPVTSFPVNVILNLGVGSSFLSFVVIIIIHICMKFDVGTDVWKKFLNWRSQTALTPSLMSYEEIHINDCGNANEDNTLREPALEF